MNFTAHQQSCWRWCLQSCLSIHKGLIWCDHSAWSNLFTWGTPRLPLPPPTCMGTPRPTQMCSNSWLQPHSCPEPLQNNSLVHIGKWAVGLRLTCLLWKKYSLVPKRFGVGVGDLNQGPLSTVLSSTHATSVSPLIWEVAMVMHNWICHIELICPIRKKWRKTLVILFKVCRQIISFNEMFAVKIFIKNIDLAYRSEFRRPSVLTKISLQYFGVVNIAITSRLWPIESC